MTLMSSGLAKARPIATDSESPVAIGAEQRMLESWERQIAYCQKYRELLSKKDQQFVDDLAGHEPTPSRIRHLNAITAAIQRDPRSSGGDLAGHEPTPSRIRHLKAVKAAIQRGPRSSGA